MSSLPNEPGESLEDLTGHHGPISLSFLAPAMGPGELGRLGRYRILKLLGQGGMGIVFKAEDTQLQRPVALKVIRPDAGRTSANRQRFLREARAMAQVKSDHVVTIHEVGQADDVCYLAMELLEGEPLEAWLERPGIPSLRESLRIAREIALALEAAHACGLVHRDVKPANVWLESPQRRVKLLDFGLARQLDDDSNLTRHGMVLGTPRYMAPEQARGEALDGRTDLFSLGCVLYQMVTGRAAFEGPSPIAVLTAVISDTPPPPSRFNPSITSTLNDLIMRLLAKPASGRPATATAVIAELQEIARSLPESGSFSEGNALADLFASQYGDRTGNRTPSLAGETPRSQASLGGTSRSRLMPREAERRQVTVLICGCNVFESEAYLGLEAEDQAQLLSEYHQACEKAVLRFDGTLFQRTEDGLLACFGFPIAHEDAAYRAARAGLELLEEAKDVKLRGSQRLEMVPWVGLHTGPAIVESKEGAVTLVGDARNIALRLKDAEIPGRVICTDATQRLFKSKLRCSDLGRRKLGAMGRLVTLFVVDGEAVIDAAADGSTRAGLSPIIGRDHEINLLKDRWEQAQEGAGQVVLLVGEPGLGKSRLVQSVKDAILAQRSEGEADAPVIEWRCSPHYQNSGLHPALDFFERALGFRPQDQPAERFEQVFRHAERYGLARPEVVPLWASLLSLPLPKVYPPLSLPPARQREETFRLILEWLHVRASRGPLLFVVEDLHWADASTLEFLGCHLAEFQHERILTLLTFRPEFKPPWAAAERLTTLSLNRLTRRQVEDLMRSTAGESLPSAVIEQVYDRAGGVPLFVEEFTRMVRETEQLDSKGARGLDSRGIPSTLQDLVMSRLDRMEGSREAAQLASVLGREFTYELIAAVSPLDAASLQAELDQLIRAEIVYAKGRPPRCSYTFKHALLVDALYNALVKGKRQQLHQRVAEALESRFPQTAEAEPELLAYHFTESGLIEKAIDYWLKAGERSREKSALNEAISHLNRGLSLLSTLEESPTRDDRELRFLSVLGPVHIAARGYAAPEAGRVLLRAVELCRRIEDPRRLFGVLLGIWEWRLVCGDLRLCPELAAEGLAIAEQLDDPGMMMEALFMPSVTVFYRGEFEEARKGLEKSIASYDDRERTRFWAVHTGQDSGVTQRCYLSHALWHLGFPEQALQMNREALTLAREIGHKFTLAHAVDFSAVLHLGCGMAEEVRKAAEEEKAIGTEQGFQLWRAVGMLHLGAASLLQGKVEEALPVLLDGYAAFRATGAEIRAPVYLGLLGEAYTQAGRYAEAHRALEDGLVIAAKNDDRCHEAELHRLQGELLLAESPDQSLQAEECFRRAIEMARRQKSRAWELRAALNLARLMSQQHRREEARVALTSVYSAYTEGFTLPDLVQASEMLKALA